MTTNVKGKAMTTDVKGKTKASGAKGKTKATGLKEFLKNLATDARKLGEFLHEPEAAMSAANLSEEDKTALRSGVAGMVAARMAGVPLDQAFKPMAYWFLFYYLYPMKMTPEPPFAHPMKVAAELPMFAMYPQKVAAELPMFVMYPQKVAAELPMFAMYPQKVAAELPMFAMYPQKVAAEAAYPPTQYMVYPPQFVVQPPPQYVVYPPYYPR
jgi:hypothetical protein